MKIKDLLRHHNLSGEVKRIRLRTGLSQGKFVYFFNWLPPQGLATTTQPNLCRYETGKICPNALVYEKMKALDSYSTTDIKRMIKAWENDKL